MKSEYIFILTGSFQDLLRKFILQTIKCRSLTIFKPKAFQIYFAITQNSQNFRFTNLFRETLITAIPERLSQLILRKYKNQIFFFTYLFRKNLVFQIWLEKTSNHRISFVNTYTIPKFISQKLKSIHIICQTHQI